MTSLEVTVPYYSQVLQSDDQRADLFYQTIKYVYYSNTITVVHRLDEICWWEAKSINIEIFWHFDFASLTRLIFKSLTRAVMMKYIMLLDKISLLHWNILSKLCNQLKKLFYFRGNWPPMLHRLCTHEAQFLV